MSSVVEKPPSKHQACGIHGNDGLESLQTDGNRARVQSGQSRQEQLELRWVAKQLADVQQLQVG